MYELLITNCSIPNQGTKDIACTNGKISQIADAIEHTAAKQLYDAGGNTVLPSFIDIHTHTDKTLLSDRLENRSGTLPEAVKRTGEYFLTADGEDFIERGEKMVHMAADHGTLTLRSHVSVQVPFGLKIWEATRVVQERCRGFADLQLVAFPGAADTLVPGNETWKLLDAALDDNGAALGGCPTLSNDHRAFIDSLIKLAKEHGCKLDLHVDEHDRPNASVLEYLADATIREGMQGRVIAGHCTSLSAAPQQDADRIIGKVRDAGIHIVTLPSCNLFLMGRNDRGLIRRGITRVSELLSAGVNVSLASDNIRDPFRPFGNGNLLEEAYLTGQLLQAASKEELLKVIDMITINPASAMGLEGYGLKEGNPANLVVLGQPGLYEALLAQDAVQAVVSKGRIITERKSTITRNR